MREILYGNVIMSICSGGRTSTRRNKEYACFTNSNTMPCYESCICKHAQPHFVMDTPTASAVRREIIRCNCALVQCRRTLTERNQQLAQCRRKLAERNQQLNEQKQGKDDNEQYVQDHIEKLRIHASQVAQVPINTFAVVSSTDSPTMRALSTMSPITQWTFPLPGFEAVAPALPFEDRLQFIDSKVINVTTFAASEFDSSIVLDIEPGEPSRVISPTPFAYATSDVVSVEDFNTINHPTKAQPLGKKRVRIFVDTTTVSSILGIGGGKPARIPFKHAAAFLASINYFGYIRNFNVLVWKNPDNGRIDGHFDFTTIVSDQTKFNEWNAARNL